MRALHGRRPREFPKTRLASGGRDFEGKFLLRPATNADFAEYLKLRPSFHRAKLTKDDFYLWATHTQPEGWNPACPPTRLAREFFEKIASKLPEAVRGSLRMFVATGTPLDYCGVDFWLECNGVRVTFDLTTNPNKRGSGANFVLRAWQFARNHLENFARTVARFFEKRLRSFPVAHATPA